MTPETTPEDEMREQAKRELETPQPKVPDAADLPDDVKDGTVEDPD